MSHRLLILLAVGCLAGPSHGALLSFAPDVGRSTAVFTGAGDRITDARDASDPLVLLVDDVEGPLPAIPFGIDFQADLTIAYLGSVPTGGGLFTHSYRVSGTFAFVDLSGNTILNAAMAGGVLAVVGDAFSWHSAATVQAGAGFGAGSAAYEWLPDRLLGYDIAPGWYFGSDIQFRLTGVRADGSNVPLDPETHLPSAAWVANADFHGQNNIPGPGTSVVAILYGLAALRRRRPRA